MARYPSRPNPQLNLTIPMSDHTLDQHPRADDLRYPLPDGWYLQEQEGGGGRSAWFCQHPESMVTTDTHGSPETAAQYAHQKHQAEIDPEHTLPWEEEDDNDEADLVPTDDSTTQRSNAQRANVPTQEIEVFDAETGDMVRRSPEEQRRAMHLMHAIQMSTMVQAVALARMDEGKHYLDMGHSSFKEFADAELPFTYRMAKMYLKIGRRFSGLLPEVDASEETTREALEAQIEESDTARPYAAMGVSKLREITRLEEEDMEALAEGKTLKDPETGDTYTLEDLKEMAASDVKESVERVRREKEAYQAKAQRLEETNKRLQSEKEAMEEEVEQAQEMKEEATELEAQYGPAAQTYEDNKAALTDTRDLLFEVRETLFKANLDEKSADGLKNQLLEVVRELNAIHADARSRFAEALNTAEDTVEMEDEWEPSEDILAQVEETNADTNGEA